MLSNRLSWAVRPSMLVAVSARYVQGSAKPSVARSAPA